MKKTLKAYNRGQGLTEFALILPILLIFVFLIVDLSRAAYYYSVVFNSAREGARFAVAHPVGECSVISISEITSRAKLLASGLDPSVIVNYDCDQVEVEVRYTFTPATPVLWNLVGDGSITLRSKATMQFER